MFSTCIFLMRILALKYRCTTSPGVLIIIILR